jgi:uncharacterized protein with HEPN domain
MHSAHPGRCCRGRERFLSSSQRLSEILKARHPEIDWRRIAAFRNVLVHDYLGIDLGRVWDIVQRDVPVLKSRILALLDEVRDDQTGG